MLNILIFDTNINNRYYILTDLAPVHFARVALHPEMKFKYWRCEWSHRPDWIQNAEQQTRTLWETEYKSSNNENYREVQLRVNTYLQAPVSTQEEGSPGRKQTNKP